MTKLIKTAAFLAFVVTAPAAYADRTSDPADNTTVRNQMLDVARGGRAVAPVRSGIPTFTPGSFGQPSANDAPARSGFDNIR